MDNLVQLGRPRGAGGEPRPAWLKVRIPNAEQQRQVAAMVAELGLNTVCQEARCPNLGECWGAHRTATFMILGDTCTRACRYCSVHSGRPAGPPDADEPARVADAVARLGLRHAVVTSVDRDDLRGDYGADHFVATIGAIVARSPGCRVEVLIPDFAGDAAALARVLAAGPAVLNHNTETVPRLYRRLRSRGQYPRTLAVLAQAARYRRDHGLAMTTKSGLMVGLGETHAELLQVMDDLRAADCDVLTLGQYLTPTDRHVPIERYYHPDEFAELAAAARARGFLHVESGPLVRSSYHAHAHVPATSRDAAPRPAKSP